MKKEIIKNAGIALLAGVFGLGVGAASAAENAAGVKEHMDLTVKTTKEALEHATLGHGDMCVTSLKETIQHYKEITGDAAGKPLQDTMKKIKAAKESCQGNDTATASTTLKEAVAELEKIQAGVK